MYIYMYIPIYLCSRLSFISVVSVTDQYVFLLILFGIGKTSSSLNHLYCCRPWSDPGY